MANKGQYSVAVVNEIDLTKTGVTFEAGATLSSALDCGGTMPASIFLPAGWTTCDLSFHICKTPTGTFVPLTYFDGDAYTVSTTASKCTPLIPALFHSQLYVKLSCSTPQISAVTVDFGLTPVYQGIHS